MKFQTYDGHEFTASVEPELSFPILLAELLTRLDDIENVTLRRLLFYTAIELLAEERRINKAAYSSN